MLFWVYVSKTGAFFLVASISKKIHSTDLEEVRGDGNIHFASIMKTSLVIIMERISVTANPFVWVVSSLWEKGTWGNISQGVPKPPGHGKWGKHVPGPGECVPMEHWSKVAHKSSPWRMPDVINCIKSEGVQYHQIVFLGNVKVMIKLIMGKYGSKWGHWKGTSIIVWNDRFQRVILEAWNLFFESHENYVLSMVRAWTFEILHYIQSLWLLTNGIAYQSLRVEAFALSRDIRKGSKPYIACHTCNSWLMLSCGIPYNMNSPPSRVL